MRNGMPSLTIFWQLTGFGTKIHILMAILISYGVEWFYFQLIIKIPQMDKV